MESRIRIPMVGDIAHIFLTDAQDMLPPARAEETADYFAALVTRACTGDALAFERIMLATEQRVVSIAWRMLGNRDDASDAAQEVYLRVFKYLTRFRAGEDFRGWLYRITINVCHDISRKRRLTTTTQFEDIDFGQERMAVEATGSGGNPEALALHAQQLALVRRALQSLPVKERAALVLRDLEGLSTEEVARVLGSRPVTVRSQISSARGKIKTYCDRLLRQRGV